MKKFKTALRLTVICALFITVCVFYLITLVNFQITGQDYYTIIQDDSHTYYSPIPAKRGEIYDRNGKALVINTTNYNVTLEYGAMPSKKADFNAVILNTLSAIEEGGGKEKITEPTFPFVGKYPNYTRNEEFFESETNRIKFDALQKRLNLLNGTSDESMLNYLRTRYGIASYDKASDVYTENYTEEEAATLLAIRFDMEYMQFSAVEPYTLATDISLETLTYIKERAIGQVMITEEPARTYLYDGYASHILGHIAKIPAESLDKYIELGYARDAYVGRSGVEEAFEEHLKGTNGTLEIVEDAYGNRISERVVKEPIPGNDIYLTIDIDLQISAEKALKDNIEVIHKAAANSKGEYDGEDANSAAAVAIDPNTAEVLAIASYPSFKLSDYTKNYSEYASDPRRPLYNRALYGTYTPGSTFKPAVAAAALEEGIITKYTTFYDDGQYEIGNYAPRCWYFTRYGRGHGDQNVVQAIQNSCNFFFYATGERLGIEKMNIYAKKLGLGEPTGIKLGESVGILAGPEYRKSKGGIWTGGDTVQAAIGQSDNMFSPLQLAVYTSALVNGGTRFRAHLLKEVKTFPEKETVVETATVAIYRINFKEDTLPIIKSAMKDVVESGSAARIFKDYDIPVGGKTGTAEVGKNKSANALFIGFAPYANPEIAVSVVIEQGANGTDAAYTAKAIYDCYLKGKPYVAFDETTEEN